MNATLTREETEPACQKSDPPLAKRQSAQAPTPSAAQIFLELASFRARVPRIAVEEYHRQSERNINGRRTELIRGIVIEKMAKSPLHGTIATRLHEHTLKLLPQGFCVRKEEPLTLRDSEPEPDVSILRGDLNDYLHSHPTSAALVAEVAVTSAEEDREQAYLYAENGVEEYWIVLPRESAVEVYRMPENGRYREMRLFTRDETLECRSVPGVSIALGELFAGIDPTAGSER